MTDASFVLDVMRPAVESAERIRTPVPEMVLRIEKAFGIPLDTLMAMQSSLVGRGKET